MAPGPAFRWFVEAAVRTNISSCGFCGCLSGFAAADAHHHFVTDGIVSPETEGVTFRGLLDM
jgi:hypothetical protein